MKHIAVYFDSWASKWGSIGSELDLANLDIAGVNIVNIAFVKPDCCYKKGQKTWEGTGLSFSQDFSVVYGAIKILQNRGITVMLSVGGGSYPNWGDCNFIAIKDLVSDLDVCGIDVDWEGSGVLLDIMKEMKFCITKYLSFAGWSTGAFEAQDGDAFRGSAVETLKWGGFDWCNIMAYDAGAGFDVCGAYDASGDLLVGFEVGPPGWGGYLLTEADVAKAVAHVTNDLNGGIFVWSWGSDSTGTPTLNEICTMAHAAFMRTVNVPVVTAPVPEVTTPVVLPPVNAEPAHVCPCHRCCHSECPRTWCHSH